MFRKKETNKCFNSYVLHCITISLQDGNNNPRLVEVILLS